MKSRNQKAEELKRGEKLLQKSEAVLFLDISKVRTADLFSLRNELKQSGNPLMVIKKRLLGLLLKQKTGQDLFQELKPSGTSEYKTSLGTVFVADLERAAAAVYKFFRALETEKKLKGMNVLGGYDLKKNAQITKQQVIAIGALPPREVLLGQLLGMIAAPIRSFLYVLDQKSKK